MASFQKFNCFTKDLAEGVHSLQSHTLKILLTAVAPVAGNSVLADLTEIASGNGYTAGGSQAFTTSSTQTNGLYRLILSDPATWTASGGTLPSTGTGFRYAVLYNASASGSPLVGFWDYLANVVLQAGESFAVDLDPSTGALTIA